MAKNRRLSGWQLTNDEVWKERMAEMMNRAPLPAQTPAPHKETLTPPIESCDPNCVICHGNAFYIDSQDIAIECPNARRKMNGGG